ncbi:hypothetical protein GCM10027579_13680 [Calidifontibacter terrae]
MRAGIDLGQLLMVHRTVVEVPGGAHCIVPDVLHMNGVFKKSARGSSSRAAVTFNDLVKQ